MRYALNVPNLAEPARLVELGAAAERAGWHGVFLWDHVFVGADAPMPVADPWVVLGALAVSTERVRLGTAVTPLARRRPQKLAREAVTVDRLSGGRLTLGVGLGNPPDEYLAFGESADPRQLAERVDEALDVVVGLWSGEPFEHHGRHHVVTGARFLPPPAQSPRIPVWTACVAPHRAPLARAARWDGVVLAALTDAGGIDPLTPDQVGRARDDVAARRGGLDGFDLTVVHPGLPGAATAAAYADLGVSWVHVTGWIDELAELAAAAPAPG
jgi:alkanesulfonate monooxygenase SsuD/methylene tetrahydromethanopterin reductase-like flavin-dependent oxidoreductase (luciferase family)